MDSTQTVNRNGYLVEQVRSIPDNLTDLSPHERYLKRQERKKHILKATITGIIVCVICAVIKYVIGMLSNSLAIESDAVSSLTESYSYIISTIGIYVAHKLPDKKHPNGYGRIEFLTAVIGGVLIIVTGWHYFESSLKRIGTPETSTVTSLQLIIIGITLLGKLYLFFDDKKIGKTYSSAGLVTASKNALLSSFSTVLVIFAAVIYKLFSFDIDGWIGLIIAILMILTGIDAIKNGIGNIIGKPIKASTGQAIQTILMKNPPIIGVYDLRVNDNGAGIIKGTVNAEVPSNVDAEEVYRSFTKARTEVYRKLGIDLTIGLLTVNYCREDVEPIFHEIRNQLMAIDGVEGVHGFDWNRKTNDVDLHILVNYKDLNNEELNNKIENLIREYIPKANVLTEYHVNFMEKPSEDKPVTCSVNPGNKNKT